MRIASRILKPLLFVLALTFVSCSRDSERVEFKTNDAKLYLETLNHFRAQKDIYSKTNLSSPLTSAEKMSFQHLNYYPPNFGLIYQVKLLKESLPERMDIQATGGEMRPAVKYGKFEFEVGGQKVRLYVYKMLGDASNDLFLPFTDETCGKTSYSGGRYIDLKENESGSYRLDFNYAYNPYCAYNHNFSCPIVPQENHLDIPIAVGEMKYGD